MEAIKEVLPRVMNLINTKESPEKSTIPHRIYCESCRDIFIVDYHQMRNVNMYQVDTTICSPRCLKEYKQRISDENYKRYISIIPPKFRDIDYDKKELIKELYGKSIFITGNTGVGKTTLMTSLLKEYLKNLKEIKWISYPSFIMELQSAFRKDSESPFDMAATVAGFGGVLAIDDIGAEKLTDFVRQITYYILNEREQRELPILITSNFSLAEIDEMIDSRVSSRIAGMCEVIKLTGKDRRIK